MKVFKTRYIDAFVKMMTIFAIVHFGWLLIVGIIRNDWSLINFFNIMDIDLVYPSVLDVKYINLYSGIIILFVYMLIYQFLGDKDKS